MSNEVGQGVGPISAVRPKATLSLKAESVGNASFYSHLPENCIEPERPYPAFVLQTTSRLSASGDGSQRL